MSPPRVSRRGRFAVALLGFVVAVVALAGCGEADPEELRAAADSLVPAEARVVDRDEGACIQLSTFPSCVELEYLVRARSDDERTELVRAAASAGDWDPRGEGGSARGSSGGSGGGGELARRRDAVGLLVRLPRVSGLPARGAASVAAALRPARLRCTVAARCGSRRLRFSAKRFRKTAPSLSTR